jgi:hypothetical protein
MTKSSSKKACPRIIKGPALNPLLKLSLIVTVSTGPGMIAPENPMIKLAAKI